MWKRCPRKKKKTFVSVFKGSLYEIDEDLLILCGFVIADKTYLCAVFILLVIDFFSTV